MKWELKKWKKKKKKKSNLNPVRVFSKTTTTLLGIGAIYLKRKQSGASEKHCIYIWSPKTQSEQSFCLVLFYILPPHHTSDKVLCNCHLYIFFIFFINKIFKLISSFFKSVKLNHFLQIIIIIVEKLKTYWKISTKS